MDSSILLKYFPNLTKLQIFQFDQLGFLYQEWNKKINVVSRKDIDHIYERHILHSLSIAQFIHFRPDSKILDVGTGGGFPGIPLAVLFPETEFLLVDSIGKKIRVCQEVSSALGLKNLTVRHLRMEKITEEVDFIVSRAVAPAKQLYNWTKHLISDKNLHQIPNGWILLKGGDLMNELNELQFELIPISHFFEEIFFKTKKIVYFHHKGLLRN